MALVVYDRVQETTATTGTGAITLAGAVSGYQSFSVVGNGNTTYYCILNGVQWEVGLGTYSTTGPTLTRTTVLSNSNGNTSPITLAGTSNVFVTYPAEKSINYDANGVATIGEVLGYSDTGMIASFASTVAGYNQVALQNKSSATNASANFNVSNDVGTAGANYAEFGINSSTFSNGPGCFNIAGASYLASASTDLSIGTYGAYNIHFATNSSTTDSMTIFNDGGTSLGGYGNPGIGNLAGNKFVPGYATVVSSGGTTTLTSASTYYLRVTGTSTQTVKLPDATTLLKGTTFAIDNDSTQSVSIADGAGTVFDTTVSGSFAYLYLIDNSTLAGSWARYHYLPNSYDFGTNSASFGNATITNATWNGSTVGTGYGGTGLTGFSAANNAIYSNSSSTLTAGTLPIAAGGTGATSYTANYIPYVNGTNTGFTSNIGLQFNGSYLIVGGTTPLSGATNPIAAFSSTANNYVQTYTYNANTGISASADYVAYANNSTDTHGWADMGFTCSNYADTTYTVTGPNEAYLFGSSPSGAGATGNLVYATDNTGSANAHQWYVGGFTQAKNAWKMQLTSTGLQLANALAASYGGTGVAGTLTGLSYMNGASAHTAATAAQVVAVIGTTAVANATYATTAGTASTTSTLTFNNGGTGGATGSTFNGGSPLTVSYNTIGASPTAGSTSLNTVGTVTTGTWTANAVGASYGGTGVAGTLTGLSYMNGASAHTAATAAQVVSVIGSTAVANATYATSSGSVTNALTMNNGGTGAASGSTYNGSGAVTISYNSIGAAPSGGSTSITSLGTVTAGTWNANAITASYGGTGVAGTLTGISYMNGTSAHTAATAAQVVAVIGSTAVANATYATTSGTCSGNSATASALQGLTSGASGSIYTDVNWSQLIQGFTTTGAFGWRATSATSVAFSCTAAGAFSATSFTGSGSGLTGTASSLSIGGNAATATTLIGDQTNWASYRSSAVANMLSWKNYGNGHVIFDASNGTSPTGSAVNNTNAAVAWSSTYPTLMGWNGSSTYGVRVDSARVADSATSATTATYLSSTAQTNLIVGQTSTATDVNTANDSGSFSIRGDTTKVASVSFHRAGAYAINMGLGTDNVFRIGGWSASSNCLQLDGSGNLSSLANVTSGGTVTATNPFFLNPTTVSANYTVPANYNAHSAGPITINTGVTVTVSTGSTWVIV